MKIVILSDIDSWFNDYINYFYDDLKKDLGSLVWVNKVEEVPEGDICILLGCGQYMNKKIRNRNKNNIVVHESKLPCGKGWSPLTWQILEGKNNITISLIELDEKIDSGLIYYQEEMIFNGFELIDELRKVQAEFSFKLCKKFIQNYPNGNNYGKIQKGRSSYYSKRSKIDSELDLNKSLNSQFNLLRICDNERYPAFFKKNGNVYRISIDKVRE